MADSSNNALQKTEKPPRRRGRKPVLTFEKIDKICNYIRAGNYQKVAAALCGVKERTWYASIERAEKAKRPTKLQKHLLQSIAEAEAQFEALHVQNIFSSKDPKVSLEMLSRRFPERWAATRKNSNVNRNVDKDGNDVPQSGVLLVPGPVDENEWQGLANRYKEIQLNPPIDVDED